MPVVFVFIVLLLSSNSIFAQKQPELTADEPIVISHDGSQLVATGHAQIIQDRFFLEADQIEFDRDGGGGSAQGQVQIAFPPVRLVSNTVEYEIENKRVISGPFKIGRAPIFIHGQSVSGNAQSIHAEKVDLYWQEPDALAPRLKVSQIHYLPDQERLIAHHAWFYIGKVPFFYLPYLNVRTIERPFSLEGRFGYRRDLGAYTQTTTQLSIIDGLKLGLIADYYTQRGFLFGPKITNRLYQKSIQLEGFVDAGFIQDHGNRGLDILGRPIEKSREFIQVREKSTLSQHIDWTAKIDYWSDSFVTRDFKPASYFNNQEPDNFIEGTWGHDGYYLTFFTRFNPNNFEEYVERLPEIRFKSVPRLWGRSGIYQTFEAAYARLQKRSLVSRAPRAQADRLDFYYGLSRPISAATWLQITPVAGARLSSYTHTTGMVDSSSADYTRLLGQIGVDVTLKSYGLWDYQSSIWRIDGLKHTLLPMIQYRYIPQAQQGQEKIPFLDDTGVMMYPQPLDLGERRDIDHMEGSHVVRLGIQNSLDTKHLITQNYRELLQVDCYQDIRFTPKPQNRTWSDFYTTLTCCPTDFLSLRVYSRIDPEAMTLQEMTTALEIYSGNRWNVKIGTSALQHQANQFWIHAFYRIDKRNRLKMFARYDARKQSFTEQYYSYWVHISNAWEVEPYIGRMLSASREKGWEVGIKVALVDL